MSFLGEIERLRRDLNLLRYEMRLLSSDIGFIDAETPTGNVDGSNRVFFLSAIPDPHASLRFEVNGINMAGTQGGVEVAPHGGRLVKLSWSPPSTATVRAWYRYKLSKVVRGWDVDVAPHVRRRDEEPTQRRRIKTGIGVYF